MRRLVFAIALVSALPARADWEVKRSPFDARVEAGYKQLVHANPDDADALAKVTASPANKRQTVVLNDRA